MKTLAIGSSNKLGSIRLCLRVLRSLCTRAGSLRHPTTLRYSKSRTMSERPCSKDFPTHLEPILLAAAAHNSVNKGGLIGNGIITSPITLPALILIYCVKPVGD